MLHGMRNGWPDPCYIFAHWTWAQLMEYSEGLIEMLHGGSVQTRGRSVSDATPDYLRSIANYTEG